VRYGAWNALYIIEKTEDVEREKCYVQKYTNQGVSVLGIYM
jgi:hypothetical protein